MEWLFEKMLEWPLEDYIQIGRNFPLQFAHMNTKQTCGYFDFI
jgi:hypothetical protein